MSKSRSFFAAMGGLPGGTLVVCFILCGCEKSEQIEAYSVPKHEALQTTTYLEQYERWHPKPKRMIGVIIPRESSLWFFKLEGEPDAVAARATAVRDFLKTVQFSPDDTLDWTLPDGWKRLPGNDMRYATLVLDGKEPLEISVSKLQARPEMPLVDQIVANINRWRRQLSLPSIQTDDLDHRTEKLKLNDVAAYWIDIIGRPVPKTEPMGQMQQQAAHPKVTRPTNEAETSARSGAGNQAAQTKERSEPAAPVYDKPTEWTDGPSAMFAVVSLQASEGDKKVAITVTPARGDRLANVNRWREQLKLGRLSASELTSTGKKVEVGTLSGELYEMSNEERTIFGVIVEDRGQTWFVKLDGNKALAERERPRFETFLKSLKLE